MTSNRFGGRWTATKLELLRSYLGFYTQALKGSPSVDRPFKLLYIDAFAGTGRCHIQDGSIAGTLIDGSATIALMNDPPFHRYHFIEPNRRHQAELEALIATHPLKDRCRVGHGTAEAILPFLLKGYEWKSHRGVLFLDPFGLQCSWQLLQQVAATKALDVFFLLSLSGLFRNAAIDLAAMNSGHAAKLDSVLGTPEWRDALYTQEQGDFFDSPQVTRPRGWQPILDFTSKRLAGLFPYVAAPALLGTANGPPLFALYFAVSNPGQKARELARKVSSELLSKLA